MLIFLIIYINFDKSRNYILINNNVYNLISRHNYKYVIHLSCNGFLLTRATVFSSKNKLKIFIMYSDAQSTYFYLLSN